MVREKETLYGIAHKYHMTLEELVSLNELSGYDIKIGQRLQVADTTQVEISRVEPPTCRRAVEKRTEMSKGLTSKGLGKKEEKMQGEVLRSSKARHRGEIGDFYKRLDSLCLVYGVRFDAVIEEGFVAPIGQFTAGVKKTKELYYALHRDLPVGTVVRIKNQINNKSVAVRVIGRLPDIDANKALTLRITQRAYQALSSPDAKAPVTLSYLRLYPKR